MKVVFSDFKRGEAKVKITALDDFWYLSQIIDSGDIVKGETVRKIKVGSGENQDSIRKPVFLSVEVEKTDFQKKGDVLRVAGIILEGPEDVPKGSHHTFNVEINSTITIIKKKWYDYQIDRLNDASVENQPKVLLLVFDREEAIFALATSYGYEKISNLKGEVQKKDEEQKISGNFYQEIVSKLKEYLERYKIERIVAASPAFWREYLIKQITETEIKKKLITATCSSVDDTAFNEVLKRPEVETALKESRAVEEINLVEELLDEIMKNALAKYGLGETACAAELGAVKIILITDSFIRKCKEEGNFADIDKILKRVDSSKGKIKIISSEHDGGKKLDGLGGIAAILRYKID
ncbi:mRNA surveillance protein pelota [Candidatus Woesearchaeota archaeon]|nr:mRNA surveillance protein pelota [Candidatus Woesearchaeota archaeon]